MFTDKQIAVAYENAPRFDESRLYASSEYTALCLKKNKAFSEMFNRLPEKDGTLLQDFMCMLYDECEFECMHYFEQGWLSAKSDAK